MEEMNVAMTLPMRAVGHVEPLVAFWKEWGVLVLVLMSLSMQVILLITAEIRRRKDSGVLKLVIWGTYLLADTTAIYALGRMSVTSPMLQEQQLMAFWAPFLLLHLGGQDNITAYSIEDNRLWLRHLQSCFVEVLAASYIIYQSSIVARPTLLRPAAILMFVVGVVKYGQRVCALNLACGGSNVSGKNYRKFEKLPLSQVVHYTAAQAHLPVFPKEQIYAAHELLNFPKYLLMGPLPVDYRSSGNNWEFMYGVAEMQLSLMHDVFYSKAELIHSWHGYCVRVFSLPATVASLWLFRRFNEKDAYRRADVAATYVLLVGAVVLEITSQLRAMFSAWTCGNLVRSEYLGGFYEALMHLASIPLWFRYHAVGMYEMCRGRGGIPPSTRCWSGSMGQHNIIYMCSHSNDSLGSWIARQVGREDWWNMLVYTSSVPVSPDISQRLMRRMELSVCGDNIQGWLRNEHFTKDNEDHILNSRGRAALKKRPGLYEELRWCVDTAVDETILVWHIATHVYVSWYEAEYTGRPHPLAEVTKELSNYMMFLLAARPYMLPGIVSRQRYIELCFQMLNFNYTSEEGLRGLFQRRGDAINSGHNVLLDDMNGTFNRACQLSAKLISKQLETPGDTMLELIDDVWMELLCYVAYHCNPDSHARQLSNGGELTTIVAFLLEYTDRGTVQIETSQDTSDDGYDNCPLEMFNESEAEAIEDV